ncbi:Transcriptional adapter 2 [Smittium culicis]|uniref:Transcriptional adapter 2 n=1 Tax=Smittium culicis TaxID=133412 RepID=A0A1R1YFA7_9FUNG|nr:Transcriptional adapter 2 [Smittium culicis]
MTVTHRKRNAAALATEDIYSTGQKFHCDNCQANLTEIVRISCFECSEFDLCVTCFSKGIELGSHKYDHSYTVVSKHKFPIFSIDWTADEELLLIDGLLKFGLGNWEEVSIYVGSKSKKECESHYNKIYVDSDFWPIPDMSKTFDVKYAKSTNSGSTKSSDSLKPYKPISSQPTNHEIAGYMPGRLEFEIEYENDSEIVIKDLVFEKKLAPSIKDSLNKIKAFAKVLSDPDYQTFSAGIQNELELKNRIDQLVEWRQNGISTLAEGSVYETEKSIRMQKSKTISTRDCIQNLERLQRLAMKYSQKNSKNDIQNQASKLNGKNKSSYTSEFKNLDGGQLLSRLELELISELGIPPKSYLLLKDILLTDYVNNNQISKDRALVLLEKVSPDIVNAVYDFFINAGWIS